MKTQTVAILGLDRLGGSIGLALKKADMGLTVFGFDADNQRAQWAVETGAIDKSEWKLRNIAARSDIIVITDAMAAAEEQFQVIGDDVRDHALVLDLSPLKHRGQRWAQQHLRHGHYIGARPVLAADYLEDGRSDLTAARADLFHNSVFCLMPSATVDPKAVETAVNFGRILGASPYFMDAAEYDSLMQGIETMPGLLAAAVFGAVNQTQGWRDLLRFADTAFAASTLPLTAGVTVAHQALDSKEASLRWLDALIGELQQMRRWLYQGDREALLLLFEELSRQRENWLAERAENNWIEVPTTDVQPSTVAEQLFGRLGRRSRDD